MAYHNSDTTADFGGYKLTFNTLFLVAIAGIIIMFWQKIYDSLLKKTAGEIIDDEYSNAAISQTQQNVEALNQGTLEGWLAPTYWQKFNNAKIFNMDTTSRMIATLHSSMSGFGTDESALYNVFQSCKYKTQASWLAYNYAKEYNSSLLSDLNDDLEPQEIGNVFKIISRLPAS